MDDIQPKLSLRWPWSFTVDVPLPGGGADARMCVVALTPWGARRQARTYLAAEAARKAGNA